MDIKKDDLSTILHEIRSPINSIIGIVGLAKKSNHLDSEMERYFNQIKCISDYLLSLSNDVLSSFKHTNMIDNYLKRNFNLKNLIDEISNFFKFEFSLNQLMFFVLTDNIDNLTLFGEDLKLKQILINLLSNAVKYTPSGGLVEFYCKAEASIDSVNLLFQIKDNGIGMSEEYLDKLFLPFTRESDDPENCKGHGLGMSIVKTFLNQLSGSITVNSQVNKGTEFQIKLNFPRVDEFENKDFNLNSKNILLVDDSEIALELIAAMLSDVGTNVDTANDGSIAIEKFKNSKEFYYDLILMDLRMKEICGISATRAIRGLDRRDASKVKIIAFSSNSLEEDVNAAIKAGMDDYVIKPVESAVLFKVIKRCLN